MARSTGGKGKQAPNQKAPLLRAGESRVRVSNSGLEVWLYDDASREAIRKSGAMNFMSGPPQSEKAAEAIGKAFTAAVKGGVVVGYSLQQDDDVDVAVIVGPPLTKKEMSVGRWLEPQRALLKLPSGQLCIESNDACRLSPEKPGAKGARVDVPKGSYRLTLYRADYEALQRDGVDWKGPQEVVVLTPGGKASDAASDILPHEDRRDLTWVGRFKVSGNRAEALAWLPDMWDTYMVNLDRAAAKKLGLQPGKYFRTTVPQAGVAMVTAFSESWEQGMRLPPPAGVSLEEYGYGSFNPMSDWDGAEVLFCKRDRAKTRIADAHRNVWLPATVEVLDAAPAAMEAMTLMPDTLADKEFFSADFLSLILDQILPAVGKLPEATLPQVVSIADKAMQKLGLAPQGDWTYKTADPNDLPEYTCRLYSGLADRFAALCVADGSIELFFLSSLNDDRWVITGLADSTDTTLARRRGNSKVVLKSLDQSPASLFKAHDQALARAGSKAKPSPRSAEQAKQAYETYLAALFA